MHAELLRPARFSAPAHVEAPGLASAGARSHVEVGGGAVLGYWTAIITIDLINDWLVPGLAGGVRPFGVVAREVAVWWSTWVLATPALIAVSTRIAAHRGWRAVGGWIGLVVIVIPLHLLVTAALFSLAPSTPSVLHMAGRFATAYTLSEAMTLAGLLLTWHLAVVLHAVVGTRVHARSLAIRAGHADRLERERALNALRRELDDHLLVNVLTSAAAVVAEGEPDRAVRMLARVGDLIRAGEHGATLIPLAREIELLDRYLAVEHVRFGDALAVERDVDVAARLALLPPLLLQPLVENAVRYGPDPTQEHTRIRLVARRSGGWVEIEVHNDAPAAGALREGRGLSVVRRRIHEAFGSEAAFGVHRENGTVVARLRIPFRERP